MEFYGLENYFTFVCLAGDCPSTCCKGWNIFVDDRDYERFSRLEQRELREDILGHIEKRESRYFFINGADGSCGMLDEDGLCRIQRNSSEETLCNTCRKFPRLLQVRQGVLYFSMAASCPVISRALWQGEISFVHGECDGRIHGIGEKMLPVSKGVWRFFESLCERLPLYRVRIDRGELFGDSMGILFDILIDLFSRLSPAERKPWEEILLYYGGVSEEEADCKMEEFLSYDTSKWRDFTYRYLAYRFMSRQMMYEEYVEETFCQSMGEVFLVQAACFLEFCRQGSLPEESVCEWIQRMYRLCANGNRRGMEIKRRFCSFFQEKSLWLYLLLEW